MTLLRSNESATTPPAGGAANATVAEKAYEKIKAAIIHGELAPGIQVAEQQIALQLNVSRTPVHQALVLLEQDGWVQVLPKKGVIVEPVSVEEMRHIYELLMGLEGIAAERLASRPAGSDEQTDQAIKAAADRTRQALEVNDRQAWAAADNDFHQLLIHRSGNPHLVRLSQSIMDKSHRARLMTLADRPLPTQANADHDEIVRAILDRNPDAARRALRMHRIRGMATLLPILEKITTQGKFLQPG